MSPTGEWGYAINPDGTTTPLLPPKFDIPEERREYLHKSPGLTMWTEKEPAMPRPMTEERKQFFHYMFTTALEGGIGYWSVAEEYCWSKTEGKMSDGKVVDDLDNFHAILSSSDDFWGVDRAFVAEQQAIMYITEDQLLRIDLSVIERGWYQFMDKVMQATREERSEYDPDADFSNSYFKGAIVQYLTDMKDGDSDSDVADIVVQLGLFNQHLYS